MTFNSIKNAEVVCSNQQQRKRTILLLASLYFLKQSFNISYHCQRYTDRQIHWVIFVGFVTIALLKTYLCFYTSRYIVHHESVAPGPHVFGLRDFVHSKLFDESELLPPATKENIERDFDRLGEEMEPIYNAFSKPEGKVKRLTRIQGDTNNEDTSNEGSKVGSKKPQS